MHRKASSSKVYLNANKLNSKPKLDSKAHNVQTEKYIYYNYTQINRNKKSPLGLLVDGGVSFLEPKSSSSSSSSSWWPFPDFIELVQDSIFPAGSLHKIHKFNNPTNLNNQYRHPKRRKAIYIKWKKKNQVYSFMAKSRAFVAIGHFWEVGLRNSQLWLIGESPPVSVSFSQH